MANCLYYRQTTHFKFTETVISTGSAKKNIQYFLEVYVRSAIITELQLGTSHTWSLNYFQLLSQCFFLTAGGNKFLFYQQCTFSHILSCIVSQVFVMMYAWTYLIALLVQLERCFQYGLLQLIFGRESLLSS